MAGDRTAATTWPGRAEYFAAYEAVLARWPVAVESVDLRSPYGSTHVSVCGPRDGQPLVLLHGSGATSAVWFANVGELSRTHRVYAVDTVGEAGRSVNDGRPVSGLAGFMDWLDGLFDALELDSASLCGHSYGGWLALNYALHAPHRVHKLALLDPTDCFAGLRMSYRLRAVPVLLRPSSERMRALTVPALLLLAEKSRAHDIHKVSANARTLMPHVVSAILPDVSHHAMPAEQPEQLNRELGAFLG